MRKEDNIYGRKCENMECEKRNIEIVGHILSGLQKGSNLIEYVEDRKGHDWRYAMDISKIKRELGWYPRITFREGMKELINGGNK